MMIKRSCHKIQESCLLETSGGFREKEERRGESIGLPYEALFCVLGKVFQEFCETFGKFGTARVSSFLVVSCASHPTFLCTFTF